MFYQSSLLPITTLLLASAGRIIAAPASKLLQNPSFETGDLTGWSGGGCFSAISPALQPDLPIPESGSWTAYTGCFSDSPGFLSQVVSGVNTKKCYRVSFWSLCNAGSSLTDCAVAGSFGNGAVPLLYAGSAWTQTTFYGRPQNSDEILAFQGYNNPGVLLIDDISLQVANGQEARNCN